MADLNDTNLHNGQRKSPSANRRNFLQALAGAGAAISFSSKIAFSREAALTTETLPFCQRQM